MKSQLAHRVTAECKSLRRSGRHRARAVHQNVVKSASVAHPQRGDSSGLIPSVSLAASSCVSRAVGRMDPAESRVAEQPLPRTLSEDAEPAGQVERAIHHPPCALHRVVLRGDDPDRPWRRRRSRPRSSPPPCGRGVGRSPRARAPSPPPTCCTSAWYAIGRDSPIEVFFFTPSTVMIESAARQAVVDVSEAEQRPGEDAEHEGVDARRPRRHHAGRCTGRARTRRRARCRRCASPACRARPSSRPPCIPRHRAAEIRAPPSGARDRSVSIPWTPR